MTNNTNTNTNTNVAFKDQMQEVIPVAEAEAIRESQLEAEMLQHRHQLDEERDARLERLERQLAEERHARMQGIKKLVLFGAALLLVALAAVGGICGSGNCSGSSAGATNLSSSSDATRAPVQSEIVPTQSPVTPRPTLSPVTPSTPRPVVPPSPRPVAPPEPQPTTTTSRSESIVSYINLITLSRRTLSYPNGNSFAEDEALNWLIEDDVGTSETDERMLRQRFALATLWFANGPFEDASFENHLGTWLTPIDECDWESIFDCVGGEVTSVELFDDGLNGQLPSDLALLTAVTNLQLWSNELTGSIPTELGLLTAMTDLILFNNQLTGTIPTELTRMTALALFWIYNNNVSGDMPFCDGATRPTGFDFLVSDCNEVSCPCCRFCCPIGGFEGIPSGGTFCDA